MTGLIEDYIMIAMGSFRNGEMKQTNAELYRLSNGFKALNIDHQKGVLKTARGLLRIQRTYKTMVMDNTLKCGIVYGNKPSGTTIYSLKKKNNY